MPVLNYRFIAVFRVDFQCLLLITDSEPASEQGLSACSRLEIQSKLQGRVSVPDPDYTDVLHGMQCMLYTVY